MTRVAFYIYVYLQSRTQGTRFSQDVLNPVSSTQQEKNHRRLSHRSVNSSMQTRLTSRLSTSTSSSAHHLLINRLPEAPAGENRREGKEGKRHLHSSSEDMLKSAPPFCRATDPGEHSPCQPCCRLGTSQEEREQREAGLIPELLFTTANRRQIICKA